MTVSDMMSALREYSTVDPQVSHHLWVLVFPIVWAAFDKQQQVRRKREGISLGVCRPHDVVLISTGNI